MKNAIAYALNTSRQFAKLGADISHLKSNCGDTAQDFKRVAKKARYATTDFLDEVAIAVKREPLKSTGIAFGVGIGVGVLAGWLGTRK
jgi:ElaB/YqjD/DUF883 family membrane-anchored ribosome-binding protein